MTVAIWIIAIVETIRLFVQAWYSIQSAKSSNDLYKQFMNHLKEDDREMVGKLLKAYEEENRG